METEMTRSASRVIRDHIWRKLTGGVNTDDGILSSVPLTETQAQPDGGVGGPLPGPCLIVIASPNPSLIGQRVSLAPNEPLVIGRAQPDFGQVPLNDPKVSTKHLEVSVGDERLSVRDLGSKNGTFAAGERVQEATLSKGEVVQVGSTFLFFTIEAPFHQGDPKTLLGGISSAAHGLRAQVSAAAAHALPVLIVGPSGAGKERVAQELHRLSGRSGPLVPLNCATLSEQIAESELFGHTRGAFTGADKPREGLFQRADGGTLFLDEITTLPLSLQPKLLRALQEGRIRPVGSSEEIACAPRVVCATNENITALVTNGTFREDLFARLYGSIVTVPGLDQRREDLAWLSRTLLANAGHEGVALSTDLLWAFLAGPWPLNIRALQQCLLANVASIKDGVLGLSPAIEAFLNAQRQLVTGAKQATQAPASAEPKQRARKPAQPVLVAALQDHHGRVERVAKQFGVRRQQIYRWIESYSLDLDSFRS